MLDINEGYARAWALDAHKDQSYGGHSYRYHLEQVVEAAKKYSKDDDTLYAAAWLHDIVEDTKVTVQDINDRFGAEISDIVKLVSDPEGENRKERKKKLYDQFLRYVDDVEYHEYFTVEESWKVIKGAAIVKGVDRYANHAETLLTGNRNTGKMYVKEFPMFMFVYGKHMPEKLYLDLFEQYAQIHAWLSEALA